MNAGIYRLIYNAFRGLWMVVSECAKSHQPNSGARRTRNIRQLLLLIVVIDSSLYVSAVYAGPTVDALPNITVTTGAHTTINAPVVNPANTAGRLMTIQQADRKAILQGSSFDIGRASAVNIDHTGGAGSGTLIRIKGPKTTIDGALNAPKGNVYLINQNGILFGNGSRVNVGGLVASALDIKDSDFLNDLGILSAYTDNQRAAFTWGGDAAGFTNSLVQLEPDAKIKAALGGSVLLFAPKVINQGSIETTEGQVALAAGAKVYISFAPDLNTNGTTGDKRSGFAYAADSPYLGLAGVLVEVDPYTKQASDAAAAPAEITGSVMNDVTGRILAQRGNVTMASYMVNQSGRVVATTSVAQKGSIRLLARDTYRNELIDDGNENTILTASRAGNLTLGENSVTAILPEGTPGAAIATQRLSAPVIGEPVAQLGEKNFLGTVIDALQDKGSTATDDQIFNAPTLQAIGRTVSVGDGASIVVPGGYINLSAQVQGNALTASAQDASTRLYIGKNTLIDASGLKNVAVSSDRNFVELLLTTNELQDDPLNKNGFLYHKKVWFDVRNLPDTRVANLGGYIKQIPRSINEKLSTAGKVNLVSEGDVVQRTGAVVDVSGGTVNYTAGTHKETWVLDANNNAYALSKAPAGVTFTGFLGDSTFRLSPERAYSEGAAAGTVSIKSYGVSLDGQFKGGAKYGDYQRNSPNLGGAFNLDFLSSRQEVDILNNPSTIADAFKASDALPVDRQNKTLLSAQMLNSSEFETISIKTDGNIIDNAALNLAAGSKLTLTAADIAIHQNIIARAGNVSLAGVAGVTIDQSAKIDASGLWVNDYNNPAAATGRILTKGGDVTLSSSGAIAAGQGTLIDVSSGGLLKANGKVVNADAGKITITPNNNKNIEPSYFDIKPSDVAPVLAGELRGYALGVGGSLDISAPFVTIGTAGFNDAHELWLMPTFFQNGGFTSYSLTGANGVLVRNGSQVDVMAKNYQLNNAYTLAETGSHVADIAKIAFLPDVQRSSTSISLASQSASATSTASAFAPSSIGRGSVVVQTGALLQVDAHGNRSDSNGNKIAPKIALSGSDNLTYVDGTLRADGGTIALTMKGAPESGNDNDFDAKQAIWLGSHAKLLAAGYSQTTPSNTGLRAGSVYDGGSVSLTANKGYIVAETGSVIDVGGSSTSFDVLGNKGYQATTIASNGGVVNLTAREGMLIDATLNAKAPGALGGSLNVNLGRGSAGGGDAIKNIALVSVGSNAHYPGYSDPLDNYFPNQQWVVDISQNSGAGFSQGLQAGSAVQSAAPGVAKLAADNIHSAGFSRATLKAEDGVRFEGDVNLTLPTSLRLDAPKIEATGTSTVSLNAPNVILSNAKLSDADAAVRADKSYVAPTPASGGATLNINTQLLDLRGQLAMSGFNQENLISTGDIRLTGFSNFGALPVGLLRTTGTLNMTARQLYPTTFSDYTLAVEGTGGRAVFNGTGAHDAVLSAGGKLTVSADNIDQNGVLLAPFGTINLNANSNLTLNNGSLTSVSADGAFIPYGFTTRDGLDYLYSYANGFASVITAPPERVVKLNAPNVTETAGSVVDISAGGDLYAYEWVPGPGGSADVLANGAKQSAFSEMGSHATNTWAIMPSKNSAYGSFDTQYWAGSTIQAGDAVYLSASPGLAAGYYTLLPARYALLPGAVLVSSTSDHEDLVARNAIPQNDGSSLVSGNLATYTNQGYVSTSRTSGFIVRPGTDAHKLAEYSDTLNSQRFAENKKVVRTIDAGRFSVAATSTLVLDGILKALHSSAGSGAEADIAAPNLLVVDHGKQTGSVTVNGKTYLAVDENTLSNLNASSLLIGGTRSNGVVDVISGEVNIAANATLSGSEVILAATDLVSVQNTATVTGSGTAASARDLTIGNASVDGDGALLRVSGDKAINIARNNTDRNRGDLTIASGANVQGSGAVQLDATRNLNVAGTLGVGTGSALTVSAGRVSLGSPTGGAQVTDGLWLTQDQLAPLQQASSLTLKSYSTLDLYGAVNVGSPNLDLDIQASGISGYQNAGQMAVIKANTLTLSNPDNVAFANALALSDGTTPTLGSGNLNLTAQTVVSGINNVRVAGFNQVDINAAKEVVAQGLGTLSTDKALTISAARVTARTAADHSITVTDGLLKIQGSGSATPVVLAASQSQAATLNLKGSAVVLATGAKVEAAGAKINIEATGANASDSVSLQNGSSILAAGSTYTLKDQSVALNAGSVSLKSAHGDVEQQSGALVDVSPTTGGKAGVLNVVAVNGNVRLAGTIRGGAGAQASVDAASINGFSQALNTLKEFIGSQTYRQHTGDVVIAVTDSVLAKNFTLSADAGAINVNGKVDASGDKGGTISLYAKNDLNINRGAKLLARGLADKQSIAGTAGNGGKVVLSSDSGAVNAQVADLNIVSGALIDVTGDQVGDVRGVGGNVILRATRTGAGVNVNNATTGAVTGAASVTVEAVKVYNSANINTALQATIATDTNAFTSNVANNSIGFSKTRDGKDALVTPGVEVRSNGNLTLSNDWVIGDYSGAQKMPGGGVLTLRAAGDLLLNNKLSYEQYSATATVGGGPSVVSRTSSWSYRLVAGADANAANPESVQAGVGNIALVTGKYVRTGSGFIDAVAGQDIILANNAAIYTEGTPATFASLPALTTLAGGNATFYKEVYPVNGGEINLNALGSIVGEADASQTGNTWMYRAALNTVGLNNAQTRWWPRYDKFVNGVGALGGGDVTVRAGADVTGLQFASATNGRLAGSTAVSPDLTNLSINGGGDINLNVDGNVQNVLMVADAGLASLNTGKSADAKFELKDASANVYANGNVTIAQVSNPTITASAITATGAPGNIYYYSYGKDSAVKATAAAGDLTFGGDTTYPGTLYGAAPSGNITTAGLVLYPSATGNATLLAGNDLKLNLRMSEVNQAILPQILSSPVFTGISGVQNLASFTGSAAHTQGLLHAAHTEPVRFYAGNDVVFEPLAASAGILPKAVEIYAGNDVVDPNLIVQNNRSTDISIIEAVGNIRYTDAGKGEDGSIISNTATLQIAGPGRLHLIAGKDIDLGSAEGVRSVGDLYNPYLTAKGADIMIQPGVGAGIDYSKMIAAYLEPSNAGSVASNYLPLLVSYLENRSGVNGLSESDALTQFKALKTNQQSEFINTIFYSELRAGGRDAINSASASFGDYSRSERAILRMFPNFTANTDLANQTGNIMTAFQNISQEAISSPGNLNLFYSQIRSESGGNIELLVPSGLINAGLAVAGTLKKPTTDLGIVSVRGGDVDAFVRNNFQVNQSRVFTLGGSDLLAYSALSDIDAGRGAKTSSATPPPTLRITNGQITYDYSSAVSGSGIAALTATGGVPGTVDLFAPYGQINAGEAGIRSAGNINLGARVIIGAENITAGGVTTGGPAVSTAGLSFSAPASADSNTAGKQGDQIASADKLGQNSKLAGFPSIISVEVISLGEESASQSKPCEDEKTKDGKNKKDC